MLWLWLMWCINFKGFLALIFIRDLKLNANKTRHETKIICSLCIILPTSPNNCLFSPQPWSICAVYVSSYWMFSAAASIRTNWTSGMYCGISERRGFPRWSPRSPSLWNLQNNWIEGSAAGWLFPPPKDALPFHTLLLCSSETGRRTKQQQRNMDALILVLFLLLRLGCACKYCWLLIGDKFKLKGDKQRHSSL